MDSLAQGQALRIIAILESILCLNLITTTIQCNVVAIAIGNGLLLVIQLIYNCDFHGQVTIICRDTRILDSIFTQSIGILTNRILLGITQKFFNVNSKIRSIGLTRNKCFNFLILSCFKFSSSCCTSNSSIARIGNTKSKFHLVRSSTVLNFQALGQRKGCITRLEHFCITIIIFNTDGLITRLRRKRCGCADGEHHGGSQNARKEFLQFHCYSSLVRNRSYSCAAAQTPRFTGRMPAASSGFRGITDCVAAVV